MPRVAIVGAGIAGLTAAWQLHELGIPFDLFEASDRLGGTSETLRRDGFTIETGPDGWVTEKPWARQLAIDLGLEAELIPSNDATRVTWIVQDGKLQAMPDGMRMMVPTDLATLSRSPLFSPEAIAAYAAEPARAAELRAFASAQDESIASFVQRHFGPEVLGKVAAPLLSGVFGGDVATLSVRAVMPQFVRMEREHGSLIAALQASEAARQGRPAVAIFTTLRTGTETLIDRMAAQLPAASIHCNSPVIEIRERREGGWKVGDTTADHLILATPAHVTRKLLRWPQLDPLLDLEASSAIIAALAFTSHFPLPQGFGFLVPAGERSSLVAATFSDQKYDDRVPAGGRLLRAFFGGASAQRLAAATDEAIAAEAHRELAALLGPLPQPAFAVVRHWPRSLPQYAVGHLERMHQLRELLQQRPTLHLLGNAYHGVGLPDLIRDARALAHFLAG